MTNLEKAKKCVDSEVKGWNKTTLSDLEKYALEKYIVWGILDLALYLLTNEDYQKLKQYIYDAYGYNVGGVVTREGLEEEDED